MKPREVRAANQMFQNINNRAELKQLLDFLEEQGFGHMREWEIHDKKVDSLISKANKLNLAYPNSFKERFYKLDDYNEITKELEKHFSQFSVDDKIMEYLIKFNLLTDKSIQTPSRLWPDKKEVIEWFKFKKKLGLKDEFSKGNYVNFYNLDKKTLKINFGNEGWYFEDLYKAVFNEECAEFNYRVITGRWENLGKIEIKLYANGNADIKGDLTKLKEYYYQYITDKPNRHLIIKYNGKLEIIRDTRED